MVRTATKKEPGLSNAINPNYTSQKQPVPFRIKRDPEQ